MAKKFRRRFNGTGTVTKLAGNRRKPWLARGSVKGHQVTVGTYETEKLAYKALEEWNAKQEKAKGKLTFKDVADELMKEKEVNKLTKSGLDSAYYSMQHWQELYDGVFLELTTDDYQRIVDRRLTSDEPPSRSVLTKDKSFVKQMYELQISKGVKTINFGEFIQVRDAKTKKVKAFTDLQLKQILKQENTEHKQTVHASMVLAYTGLRINEFLNLKQKDVHFDKGYLFTQGSKTESGVARNVPIANQITYHLKELMKDKSDYLFSRKGKKVSADYYRRNYHKPFMELLNIDLTPHSFRHTAATKFRQAGMSERAIADILGHRTVSTTDNNYVDFSIDFLVDEIKKIS